MSRITTHTFMILDGVIQAPGRPDEDTRGGFPRGGWAPPYNDEVMAAETGKGIAETGALLFGRRTCEDFFGFWPNQPEPNPFTEVLNPTRKYVASTTLAEPLPWQNSTLLRAADAVAVARLREQSGKDLVILGSGELIHPLVLGSGRRLFPDDGAMASLRLVDSVTTTTGVIIATYQPAEPPALAA